MKLAAEIPGRKQLLGIGSIIFNVPNSIVFLRFLCIPVALFFVFSCPIVCFLLMQLSAWMDILDGVLARRLNQQTQLGQCFDMVVDRLFESVVLIILCLIYSHYFLFFLALMIIDLSSHFMLIYKSQLYQQDSHKSVENAPYLLGLYYRSRFVITVAIVFYQNCLGFIYLHHFYPQRLIYILALICLPGALFKIWINIIQFLYAVKCIAKHDLDNVFPK